MGISAAISLSVTGCDLFSSTAGDMAVDGEPYSEEITATAGLMLPPETETEISVDGEMLPVPGDPLGTEPLDTESMDTQPMDTEDSETDSIVPTMGDPVIEETDTDEPAW